MSWCCLSYSTCPLELTCRCLTLSVSSCLKMLTYRLKCVASSWSYVSLVLCVLVSAGFSAPAPSVLGHWMLMDPSPNCSVSESTQTPLCLPPPLPPPTHSISPQSRRRQCRGSWGGFLSSFCMITDVFCLQTENRKFKSSSVFTTRKPNLLSEFQDTEFKSMKLRSTPVI